MIELYRDPMFWYYPVGTLLISVTAFLLFAAPYTWIAWRDPARLRKYKVQDKPFEVQKYLGESLRRVFVNAGLMLLLLVPAWPLLRHSPIHMGEMPAWPVVLVQLVFFVFLDDFLYYWMHRAMHKGWLLRHVHSVHHRIRNTSAINGNFFHPIEFIMTASLALVGPMLVGAHVYVLWIWIVIRQFEAADGHCGYVFPWNPGHLFPLYEGAGYHDFHHSAYQGNYAGFLPYLDRFFGTYARGYRAWHQRKSAQKTSADPAQR